METTIKLKLHVRVNEVDELTEWKVPTTGKYTAERIYQEIEEFGLKFNQAGWYGEGKMLIMLKDGKLFNLTSGEFTIDALLDKFHGLEKRNQ